jgi:Smg protein
MKSTVIDILLFLFDHYLDDEIDLDSDRDRLSTELRNAGFDAALVGKAFEWLYELATVPAKETVAPQARRSMRVFSAAEEAKLDVACRGFIYFLEHNGIIDAGGREMIIDRVMALEVEEVDLEQLKWIILMVLFNQPGQERAFISMETLVTDELGGSLH